MKNKLRISVMMILAFLLGSTSVSAQIVYTDVADVTFHEWKDFDLDQNGSADIALSWDYDNWLDDTKASAMIPLGADAVNGFIQSNNKAIKMAKNDLINGSRSFTDDAVLLNEYWDEWDYSYQRWGDWDNMNPDDAAYLGFRFANGSDLHYGWMRLHIDPSTLYITLFDMAWEDEAGKAILAGDTASAVPVPSTLGITLAGLLLLTAVKRQAFR